jgi:hypothetical protein
MTRVPPVPLFIRAVLVAPLLLVVGFCMIVIEWITPEIAE